MTMLRDALGRLLAVAVLATVLGCANGTADSGSVSVEDLQEQVASLPGVVAVEAEVTEQDTDYRVLGVDVVVDDGIDADELAEVLRTAEELGPRVEADDFGGSVRRESDAGSTDGAQVPTISLREQSGDPGRRAGGFLTALAQYPEALVTVNGGLLTITGVDAEGLRVSEVMGAIADHPLLGHFPSTVVQVEHAAEGLPSAKVWIDGLITDVAIAHWQTVVDVVATTPVDAAPEHVYVLVRDDAIDLAEVSLGGALPEDVPADFATWNPVVGPMIEQLLLVAAAAPHEGGTEVDVDGPSGELAGVYITDSAAPSDYGDPTWCLWAADVVNTAYPAGVHGGA
ncbi:hypothetical protein [Aeromicrobium sp. Leaf350]|uniref:hypothetical protein n=1 Tax=Aeromicrobium sp. Leaf350 TaxID=2876565 RepID=UPI001E2EFAE9|nr:hypothetical protein [Aeromicrobium sp. Leaf350]